MKYVKVIIDNISDHTDTFYTYRCPFDEVVPGSKVYVPFGQGNRRKEAFVFEVSDENAENIPRLKDVEEIDKSYTIPPDLLHMCIWMKEKYLCRYIDAIKCVIPVGDAAKRAKRKDPYADMEVEPSVAPALTDEQSQAVDEIFPYIERAQYQAFLLNGVTSSGKTEVYMQVTEKVLAGGKNVIILVPEISLTPQMITRFMARFGSEKIAVMHSKLTKGQRYDQWMRIRNGGARILIGARSGIFAPFSDLGAIIIDEEHESSYKSDMTPKYDAIDAALERCRTSQAVAILGTATPSVISTFRSRTGAYKEIKLLKRYNKTPLPDIEIADMRTELKNGNRSIFSVSLYKKIEENLKNKKQVILFLNRRGYSSFVSCRTCGYVMKCPTCDVSLTYHKSSGMAECHYCGRRVKIPHTCPECGSPYIRHFGIGTEKVEELASEAFPEAKVDRLDLDTARKKGAADRILSAFRKGKTDILVGTQLVAKGLDFANVGVVGIVAADITLNIPDYRSAERTFQLIIQAAGRAGRGEEKGNVVVQTYSPDDITIKAAARLDYEGFYSHEIRMRSIAGYPPFTNIIRLVFSAENEDNVKCESNEVYNDIVASGICARGEVLPPQPAYMAWMNGTCRYHLLIKSPVEKTEAYLGLISEIKNKRTASPKTSTNMLIEIDPYSFT